jgi:hypothetical protein
MAMLDCTWGWMVKRTVMLDYNLLDQQKEMQVVGSILDCIHQDCNLLG